jgi:endoglucanase
VTRAERSLDAKTSQAVASRNGARWPRRLAHALGVAAVTLMPLAASLSPAAARPAAADESTPVEAPKPAAGPLHTEGARIVDSNGNEVRLTGVNWFGFETETFAPHGLWSRNWQEMLDQIASSGFNTIRLPYSNQALEAGRKPTGIDYDKNADLKGLTSVEVMDKIVEGAGRRGLRIILDRHRPTAQAQSDLWYTDQVSEERWIKDWVALAERYKGNDTIIGADLHNEPKGSASWGDGNTKTDWRLASERAGNAILEANPDWLIVVEGIEKVGNDYYWWGGNLSAARNAPVRLIKSDKLVYSAHDYGPGVYRQNWFLTSDFPANLPAIWKAHWSYLQLENIAPVLVGEFGGRSVGIDLEGVWQRTLLTYLKDNGINYTYWSWNPNSGDTGGVLKDDWLTLDKAKVDVLSAYQWPLLGAVSAPDAIAAAPSAPAAGDTPAAPAADTKPAAPADAKPADGQSAPADAVALASKPADPAAGGPFDPDPNHVLQGIGGPSDQDPNRRQRREEDERRYLAQFGKPWEHAAYVTTLPAPTLP